ncbi:MAG TPA: hypothetical protein VJ983_05975 [candidate division Zixibacteria bacterium]|nr:hypothetical protein [candidate division Zixibacteria bacterium]
MSRRFKVTLPDREYEIAMAWGAAKGQKNGTELFRFLLEPAMGRSKVRDLHEQLLSARIAESENRHSQRSDAQTYLHTTSAEESRGGTRALVREGVISQSDNAGRGEDDSD